MIMEVSPSDGFVSVSEVRQWSYCPRVVWHNRWLGERRPQTSRMEEGRADQAERERKEKRRTFAEYRLPAQSRRFNVYLRSERLGVSGVVDAVLELTNRSIDEVDSQGLDPERPYFAPVEYKSTQERVGRHHLLQLAGCAALLSDITGTSVPFGYFVSLPNGRASRVELSEKAREEFLSCVQGIRNMVVECRMPEPTPSRAKCRDCEFRRFCNDVW